MAATISAQVPTEISLIQNLRQVSGMFEEIQLDLAEVEKYPPLLTGF